MTRLFWFFDEVLLGAALLLPLAGAALVGLARWRAGRGVPARHAWRRSAAEVGMVAGTVPWLVMALWPIDLPAGVRRWYVVPLTDIADLLLAGPPGWAFAQIAANLLLFFVVGVFAPVRLPAAAGLGRLLVIGAAASLTLEVSQQVFGTGRVFSVDDVLLNAAGCALGGALSRRWWAAAVTAVTATAVTATTTTAAAAGRGCGRARGPGRD